MKGVFDLDMLQISGVAGLKAETGSGSDELNMPWSSTKSLLRPLETLFRPCETELPTHGQPR
jgi:hypothetical protein